MLGDTFDPATVQRLAPERVIVRGESYFRSGAVEVTDLTDTSIHAVVQGTRRYTSSLVGGDVPDWTCSCPAAADGDFCKHLVALAVTVAAIDAGEVDPPPTSVAETRASVMHSVDAAHRNTRDVGDERDQERLHDHVRSLDHDRLVAIVVEQANDDPGLRGRLMGEVDGSDGGPVDIDAWLARIDDAIEPHDEYVGWREADGWASGVEEVVDAIDDLTARGHAEAAVTLAEQAFLGVEAMVGFVDDSSSGCLRTLSERIAEVHLAACEVARPDPAALARRLVALEIGSELEGLYQAVVDYAELLGDDGLDEYRRSLDSAASGDTAASRSFTVKEMRLALASVSDDVDEMIEIRSADPQPGDFVAIIEALVGADRVDEAIRWGRRGVDPQTCGQYGVSERVIDALAPLLRERHDAAGAVRLYWSSFESTPSVARLHRLLDAVDVDDRDGWHNAAIDHVREQVESATSSSTPPRHADLLIELLIDADRIDDAWTAAKNVDCSSHTRIDIARLREAEHPLDAIDVYEPHVFELIDNKDNTSYARAVELMERIRRLAGAADRPDRFDTVLTRARTEHKPKRNVQKLLDTRGW